MAAAVAEPAAAEASTATGCTTGAARVGGAELKLELSEDILQFAKRLDQLWLESPRSESGEESPKGSHKDHQAGGSSTPEKSATDGVEQGCEQDGRERKQSEQRSMLKFEFELLRQGSANDVAVSASLETSIDGRAVAGGAPAGHVGHVQGSSSHSKSTKTLDSGDIYIGEWFEAQPHGHGKVTTVDGEVYEGEWFAGQRHGRGSCTFNGKGSYEGEWVFGRFQGWGQMNYANGDSYKGPWFHGLRHGPDGEFFAAAGDSYTGAWLHDKWHGVGCCSYANGNKYSGEWLAGLRHGIGELSYGDDPDKMYYGQWARGLQHGIGVSTAGRDGVYKGSWCEGKKSGEGVLTKPDGETYEGEWVEDLMHGRGELRRANGSVFVGRWQRGERHGTGRATLSDGTTYTGRWMQGILMERDVAVSPRSSRR